MKRFGFKCLIKSWPSTKFVLLLPRCETLWCCLRALGAVSVVFSLFFLGSLVWCLLWGRWWEPLGSQWCPEVVTPWWPLRSSKMSWSLRGHEDLCWSWAVLIGENGLSISLSSYPRWWSPQASSEGQGLCRLLPFSCHLLLSGNATPFPWCWGGPLGCSCPGCQGGCE